MGLIKLKRELVTQALADDLWSIGNQALYDLCERYPRHNVDAEILAKVWLIGRSYSASIERGRGGGADADLSNYRFYTVAVPKAFRESDFDRRLKSIATLTETDGESAVRITEIHGQLVQLF